MKKDENFMNNNYNYCDPKFLYIICNFVNISFIKYEDFLHR